MIYNLIVHSHVTSCIQSHSLMTSNNNNDIFIRNVIATEHLCGESAAKSYWYTFSTRQPLDDFSFICNTIPIPRLSYQILQLEKNTFPDSPMARSNPHRRPRASRARRRLKMCQLPINCQNSKNIGLAGRPPNLRNQSISPLKSWYISIETQQLQAFLSVSTSQKLLFWHPSFCPHFFDKQGSNMRFQNCFKY